MILEKMSLVRQASCFGPARLDFGIPVLACLASLRVIREAQPKNDSTSNMHCLHFYFRLETMFRKACPALLERSTCPISFDQYLVP